MRIPHAALILALLCAPEFACCGQSSAGEPAQSEASDSSPVSGLLQPSLDGLQQTMGTVRVEKWKGGSVRAEADANIRSIQKDLQSTLPALLKDADAAGTISKALPVSRNVDALYDVVLRVMDGARVAGPVEQVTALQDAMVNLEKGRQALNERLQEMAVAREKQVSDLQLALKAQPAPVCPAAPAPVCPPAPAPKKKVVRKKPVAPPANAQPSGTPKPNP